MRVRRATAGAERCAAIGPRPLAGSPQVLWMTDARTIKARFVILAAPRSGSNMLCTMLDSHPAILCHHEIFNPKGIRLALRLRDTDFSLGTVSEREQDPTRFLERVWTNRFGCRCVGFKLTHRQNEPVYRHLLADPTVAKVVLRRQNRLKTYVSHQISEALAEWEVYRPQDLARQRPRVQVDPQQFLDRVAFDDAYYNEIRARPRLPAMTGSKPATNRCFRSTSRTRYSSFWGSV